MASTNQVELKKPMGTYKKQLVGIIALSVAIVLLAVATSVAFIFVNRDKTSFEQGGVRYRVMERDGEYVLTNGEGYVCEKTSDGYYVTDDGALMVAVEEDGTYSIYAAVEGLESGEEVYNRVAQTILIFPYVSRSNLQALELYNEHGSYAFYRDAMGSFRVAGMEQYAATYDATLFAALLTSTCNMIAQDKILSPLEDENGEYSEYGLSDSDTYWYVTSSSDAVYKMILGDRTPSGDGYYVQYVACSDVKLSREGRVLSATETPRKAVYIVSPEILSPLGNEVSYINKPFHEPIETLMTPQIVYAMGASNYFDVENFIISRDDEAFVAFDFIDIQERAHTERSSEPYVMLLKEHKGFTASSDRVLEALNGLYGTVFLDCVKLNPSAEDLVEYGIYRNPVHTFVENRTASIRVIYYVLKQADGTYALCDRDGVPCEVTEDGCYKTADGAVIRVNAETGTGETVSGSGSWELNYTSPHSIYYTFEITEGGSVYTTEQMVYFSAKTDSKSYFAYSPVYGMIVEVAGYELEFLNWELFDWIDSGLFETNVSFVDEIRVELPDGTAHRFTVDNTESPQGTAAPISESRYTDKNGAIYARKKVDGVYGLYKTTGPEHTVSVNAHFRVADPTRAGSNVYVSYFGMPSGGRSEGWFAGKLYLASDKTLLLCDTESGYWCVLKMNSASAALSVSYNDGEKLLDTALFRKFYQTLGYATIEEQYLLTEEEEAALVNDPAAFRQRLSVRTAERDLVFEFYYLTSRKSYLRVSGDGGETFSGGMYVLTQRVDKIAADAERLLKGEAIDPTAKN